MGTRAAIRVGSRLLFGRLFGRLVGDAGEISWAVSTYFVLPIIVFEKAEPSRAISRSFDYVAQVFGETVGSNIVLSLAFLPLTLLTLGLAFFGFWTYEFGGQLLVGIVIMVGSSLLLFVQGVMLAAASAVLKVALYRYAVSGDLDSKVLTNTFERFDAELAPLS